MHRVPSIPHGRSATRWSPPRAAPARPWHRCRDLPDRGGGDGPGSVRRRHGVRARLWQRRRRAGRGQQTINAKASPAVHAGLAGALGQHDLGRDARPAAVESISPVRPADHSVVGRWAADRAPERQPRAGERPRTAARPHPVVVDGWQQGWQLPTADDRCGPSSSRTASTGRAARGCGRGAAPAACSPWCRARRLARTRPHRRCAPARWPSAVVPGVGGRWRRAARRLGRIRDRGRRRRHRSTVAGRRAPTVAAAAGRRAAMVLAAAAYLLRPWGDRTGWAGGLAWPHYLVLVASAVLVGGVRRAAPSRRFLQPHRRALDEPVEHLGGGQAERDGQAPDLPGRARRRARSRSPP